MRLAIAHAIDREQIVRNVQFGLGKVPAAPITSGLPWAHAPGTLARYTNDPQRAAELLGALGLVTAAVLLASLLADLVQARLDPRVAAAQQ